MSSVEFKYYRGWEVAGQGAYSTVYTVPGKAEVLRVPRYCQKSVTFTAELKAFHTILRRVSEADPHSSKKILGARRVIWQGDLTPLKGLPVPPINEEYSNSDVRSLTDTLTKMHLGESRPLRGVEGPPLRSLSLERGRVCCVSKKCEGNLRELPNNVDREKFSMDLLYGLRELTKKLVLHLDLRLENCLRSGNSAVISDFGRTAILPCPEDFTSLEEAKTRIVEIGNAHFGAPSFLPFEEFLEGEDLIERMSQSHDLATFKTLYREYIKCVQGCQIFSVGLMILDLYQIQTYALSGCKYYPNCPDLLKDYDAPILTWIQYGLLNFRCPFRMNSKNREIVEFAVSMVHYKKEKRPSFADLNDFLLVGRMRLAPLADYQGTYNIVRRELIHSLAAFALDKGVQLFLKHFI